MSQRKFHNRVKETTTTTGTGDLTLDGAEASYQAFNDAFSDGDKVWVCTVDGTDWEIANCTFTAPSTIARDTIEDSSNAGAAVNWGAGSKEVFCVLPASLCHNVPDETLTITSASSITIEEGDDLSYIAESPDETPAWRIVDRDGLSSEVQIDYATGIVIGGENEPAGTYIMSIQCANAFGKSSCHEVTITIDPFVLKQDNAFGSDERSSEGFGSVPDNNYNITIAGAVVYDGAVNRIDTTGAHDASAPDHLLFWDYTNEHMFAFYKDNLGFWEIRRFENVTTVAHDTIVDDPDNLSGTSNFGVISDAQTVEMHGKHWPLIVDDWWVSGNYALEITPSSGVLDDFGTGVAFHEWTYGFTLLDDWMAGTGAMQMLTPKATADGWYQFGLSMQFNGSSYDAEYTYGNDSTHNSGTATFTEDTSCIARAGEMIVIHYDGSTFKIYRDGSEIDDLSLPAFYLSSSATTDPVCTFGFTDHSLSDPDDSNDSLTGWIPRISEIWIGNNTNWDATKITEVSAHQNDVENSDNYADVDVYIEIGVSSTTVTKGSVTIDRIKNANTPGT